MAKLPIITAPDPRLRRKCAPVEAVDEAVRGLMDDMLETMYAAPGIGLAAPQVGIARRVVVVDISREDEERTPYRMANPEVVEASDTLAEYEEGCLSLPQHYEEVARPDRARIRYLDETGAQREIEVEGMLATCMQHEIDHLDGILFVDHISKLKRGMILRKLAKAKRAEAMAGA
ncbi:MAG: peptide deformylase [Defluviicoccus sp.]|nr:peptide deformylase [Defluviicoccus sp.]MDE0385579.1 peptide deformylase [Defluviicoccus sp.]